MEKLLTMKDIKKMEVVWDNRKLNNFWEHYFDVWINKKFGSISVAWEKYTTSYVLQRIDNTTYENCLDTFIQKVKEGEIQIIIQ